MSDPNTASLMFEIRKLVGHEHGILESIKRLQGKAKSLQGDLDRTREAKDEAWVLIRSLEAQRDRATAAVFDAGTPEHASTLHCAREQREVMRVERDRALEDLREFRARTLVDLAEKAGVQFWTDALQEVTGRIAVDQYRLKLLNGVRDLIGPVITTNLDGGSPPARARVEILGALVEMVRQTKP